MISRWESEKERLKRQIAMPAQIKLEWLEQMRQFTAALPKKTLAIRRKLMRKTN